EGRVPHLRSSIPHEIGGAPLFAVFAKGGTRRSQPQSCLHSTSFHQVPSDETKRQGLFKCAPLTLRASLRQSGGRAALQGRDQDRKESVPRCRRHLERSDRIVQVRPSAAQAFGREEFVCSFASTRR